MVITLSRIRSLPGPKWLVIFGCILIGTGLVIWIKTKTGGDLLPAKKILVDQADEKMESNPIHAPVSSTLPDSNGGQDEVWANSPRFALMVRMYCDKVEEYWQVFARSYLLFFPHEKWKNSELVLVFDDESLRDHQASTILSLLPPYPKIVLEKKPPPGTLCSHWRSEGYTRQMYSNYNADKLTDAPYIGFADTDSFFSTKVVIEDLFENGKPRILGYNAYSCCPEDAWEVSASSLVDGKKIGEFMIGLGFPFIVKREHLPLFRKRAMAAFHKPNFEESFHHICSAHATFSHYDFLGFYLFVYHRDDYAWHLRDQYQANHPSFISGRVTNDTEVVARSEPKIGVMKHAGHSNYADLPYVVYDYVCTEANFSEKVGSCSHEPVKYRDDIRKSVEYNLLTDMLVPTAYMAERGLQPSSMYKDSKEHLPENARSLFDERAKTLTRYNNSWHW